MKKKPIKRPYRKAVEGQCNCPIILNIEIITTGNIKRHTLCGGRII